MTTPVASVATRWESRDHFRALTWATLIGASFVVVFSRFGFPPVDVHEPSHYLGIMMPSCGLTRGVVALTHGSPAAALRYNPASPLVAAAGAALLVRALIGLRTGRWLEVDLRLRPVGWVVVAGAFAVLAVRQQLHADLLR